MLNKEFPPKRVKQTLGRLGAIALASMSFAVGRDAAAQSPDNDNDPHKNSHTFAVSETDELFSSRNDPYESSSKTLTATTLRSAIVHSAPLDESEVVTRVQRGLVVKVLGEQDAWLLVERENGVRGWARKRSFEMNEVSNPDVAPIRIGTAIANARLRAEATTQSRIVDNLAAGEQVKIIADEPNGEQVSLRGATSTLWYEIELKDRSHAFVWSGLVEVASETTNPESASNSLPNPVEKAESLAEAIRREYKLAYPLEVYAVGQQVYVRSPYDLPDNPIFQLENDTLRLLHPDRLTVEASYYVGTIEALAKEYDLHWNSEHRAYQRDDGALWYPGHGSEIPTGETNYFQSDLENGWVNIGERNLITSDFEVGKSGLQIEFAVGVDNPKLEAVGFDPRILESQATQDIIADFVLEQYPELAGQIVIIQLLSHDLSKERFLTRAEREEGMGVSAYAVNLWATGMNTNGETTFVRLSMSEDFNHYQWVIGAEVWGATMATLEKFHIGTVPDIVDLHLADKYRTLGSQIFAELGITNPNQYFDYVTPTLKE